MTRVMQISNNQQPFWKEKFFSRTSYFIRRKCYKS
ncbi:hypothetical protein Gotur_035930, partial [Gossypium turneri]